MITRDRLTESLMPPLMPVEKVKDPKRIDAALRGWETRRTNLRTKKRGERKIAIKETFIKEAMKRDGATERRPYDNKWRSMNMDARAEHITDHGGEICSVCWQIGCDIGPMVRF